MPPDHVSQESYSQQQGPKEPYSHYQNLGAIQQYERQQQQQQLQSHSVSPQQQTAQSLIVNGQPQQYQIISQHPHVSHVSITHIAGASHQQQLLPSSSSQSALDHQHSHLPQNSNHLRISNINQQQQQQRLYASGHLSNYQEAFNPAVALPSSSRGLHPSMLNCYHGGSDASLESITNANASNSQNQNNVPHRVSIYINQ